MGANYSLSDKAKEVRREYRREYLRAWREKLRENPERYELYKAKNREYHKRWRADHPDNIRNAQIRYWEKKAAEKK